MLPPATLASRERPEDGFGQAPRWHITVIDYTTVSPTRFKIPVLSSSLYSTPYLGSIEELYMWRRDNATNVRSISWILFHSIECWLRILSSLWRHPTFHITSVVIAVAQDALFGFSRRINRKTRDNEVCTSWLRIQCLWRHQRVIQVLRRVWRRVFHKISSPYWCCWRNSSRLFELCLHD